MPMIFEKITGSNTSFLYIDVKMMSMKLAVQFLFRSCLKIFVKQNCNAIIIMCNRKKLTVSISTEILRSKTINVPKTHILSDGFR